MAEPARRLDDPDDYAGNQDSPTPGESRLQGLKGGKKNEPSKSKGQQEQTGSDNRSNLAEQEQGGSGFSYSGQAHDGQVGKGYHPSSPNDDKGLRSRWNAISKRKKIGGGAGIAGTIVGILIFTLSLLPFELIHIKNAFYTQIGGVQSRTYQLGRQKYYSRMFFFDEHGKFSGYKSTSIRGRMISNRQTNRMVKALAANGYQIDFETKGGIQTGKVKALNRLDRNGEVIPGQSITSEKDLTSAWDIKRSGAIPRIMQNVFPDETARWHGSMAKKLYKRWRLTRSNWLGEYLKGKTGITALENKELALRGALRQHLFGAGATAEVKGGTSPDSKDQNSAEKAAQERVKEIDSTNALADEVGPKAAAENSLQLKNLSYDGIDSAGTSIKNGILSGASPDKIVSDVARSAPGTVTGSLSALGVANQACTGKHALDSIVIGARVLRATQLMRFGMSVLNIADAVQKGKPVSTQEVDVMMSYLNSKDSNGNTLFDSSAWRYWNDTPAGRSNFSFSKFDAHDRNKYSVGGGFTGVLASIDSKINEYKGGSSCHALSNPFVQVAGFAIGITAGVLSAGSFTATNFALNLAVGVVANAAVSIATQMLTPIVAGTIVNGSEKGTAIGNALVSGLEVLSNANGANAGMMPLSTKQYNVALADTQSYQNSQLAKMSIKDRLFSTKNQHSLTMVAAMNLKTFKVANLFHNPFASFAHIFSSSSFFGSKASADSLNNGCTDKDITGKGLAATPFCTVEVGIPQSMIDDPRYTPEEVDHQMTGIDQNGNVDPNVVDPQVDENGVPLKDDNAYAQYLKQCTSDNPDQLSRDYRSIDIIHESDQNQSTLKCIDHPLYNMYRFYSYIGQTENDGLTGSNISDSGSSTTASTRSQDTATVSGDSKQLAQQILDASGSKKITFSVLNAADRLDQSTPEDNIRQTAAGQPAHTSTTCGVGTRSNTAKPPTATAALDVNLLKFIFDLSQAQAIQINALAGQCHSTSSSNHYVGKAVDFNCPFNASVADSIGAKYGISKNSESCADREPHYHYSTDGH